MLAELSLSGLGVIDHAAIEPAAGLTVVTGETGAGKTMIVTALGLVCGGRADSGRVRASARRAVIEARLQPVGGAMARDLAAAAEELGGDLDEDGSLLIARTVSADGRSRAHIGGRSAPVAALAQLTEPLIAIHGQSEAMSVTQPAHQRAVVDSYAGLSRELDEYRQIREELGALRDEIHDRTSRARDVAQREQLLRMGCEEIARVDPHPGEEDEVAAEIARCSDIDALRAAATEAAAALIGAVDDAGSDDEPSAAALIHHAVRTLESATDPELAGRLGDLKGALAVLTDIGGDLTRYLGDLDADPARLAALMDRQAQLRSLMRKYGDTIDAVLAWAQDAATELVGLDSSDEAIGALRRQADDAAQRLGAAAGRLTAARQAAAEALSAAATAELEHLAMGRSSLRIAVTPLSDYGPDGADQVEILMRSHGGAPELPVARAASGGELSRIMLALEVVLAGADPVGTLVFDEVDAGVGGRAATEIGRRLALLAASRQVIVVTHLAQVAAFADRHYVVEADADGMVGASAVQQVDGQDRLAELARMLGGTDGAVALAHAADLRNAAKPVEKAG